MIGTGEHILGFPSGWEDSFGEDYYRQAQIMELSNLDVETWDASLSGTPIQTGEQLNVTSPAALSDQINQIISRMKQEDTSINEPDND